MHDFQLIIAQAAAATGPTGGMILLPLFIIGLPIFLTFNWVRAETRQLQQASRMARGILAISAWIIAGIISSILCWFISGEIAIVKQAAQPTHEVTK